MSTSQQMIANSSSQMVLSGTWTTTENKAGESSTEVLCVAFCHRESFSLAIAINFIVCERAAAMQILNAGSPENFLGSGFLIKLLQFLTTFSAF
ncbi:hypothetical protein AF41_02479 [Citrobacter sp. MGH 55]|nr:hypothetical protein AF41_02479 [Citrobacter sp. MGH 55]